MLGGGQLLGTSPLHNLCLIRAFVAGACALEDPATTAAALPYARNDFQTGLQLLKRTCWESLNGITSHGLAATLVEQVCLSCKFVYALRKEFSIKDLCVVDLLFAIQ